MTKDKTAMQEMIDLLELDEELKKVSPYLINIIKDVYIKKEKEKIKDAYLAGWDALANGKHQYSEDYYNEIYEKE